MMEAGDNAQNEAIEFVLNEVRIGIGTVPGRKRKRKIFEILEKGFGGDAVWVEAVGEETIEIAAPTETFDLIFGEAKGVVEEGRPKLVC